MLSKLPFFPEQASSFAKEFDALTLWLIGLAVVFTVLIAGLVVGFSVYYRRRSANEVGVEFHESALLEITWTAIPLCIVLFTFAWGAKVYFHLYRPPAGAIEYNVVAKQWMWKTQHPTGQREINELHLPVGQPARVTLTSEDVIHSFFVPAFRAKVDVLPGRYTTMWFTPTKPGRYYLFCAEYCGVEHSMMRGWVTVMELDEYQEWLASVPVAKTLVAQGAEIYARLACAECHGDGRLKGPDLRGIYGRDTRLASGETVSVDDTYLRESIFDPGARVVAGFERTMPSFRGQIDEEEMVALIRYLKNSPATRAAAYSAVSAEMGSVIR